MINPRCDGAGPCDMGQIRRLPFPSGPGAAHLCMRCHGREADYRRKHLKETLASSGQSWWGLVVVPDPNILKK